uniref:Triple gene block protein 1 n=1 Tax=Soil-borne virus 2 TaxID=1770234 RepID=A0A0U2REN5_9VIRU|nr:triple gene block protein 1 [Soil-borne virus 2]
MEIRRGRNKTKADFSVGDDPSYASKWKPLKSGSTTKPDSANSVSKPDFCEEDKSLDKDLNNSTLGSLPVSGKCDNSSKGKSRGGDCVPNLDCTGEFASSTDHKDQVRQPKDVIGSSKSEKVQSEEKPARSQNFQAPKLGSERYAGKRPLDIVSNLCVECGFKPTGQPLKRYPEDYFAKSGLLKKFDKYLSERLDKGCNLTQEETEVVLRNLRKKRTTIPFLAGTISGVPGSGKTTLLRKIQNSAGLNSAVILGNPRHKTSFSNLNSCYTAKDILLLDAEVKFDVLLVDEYTLLSNGEILLLQKILSAKIVILFGDRAQGDSSFLSSVEWVFIPVIFSCDTSHRFGEATAALCGQQGFDFKGNGQQDEVRVEDIEGSSEATNICLAFTERSVEELADCSITATLVEDVQGKEYDTVSLFVFDEDREALSNPHLRAVAYTRHRKLLILRIPQSLHLSLMNGELAEEYRARTHRYGKN